MAKRNSKKTIKVDDLRIAINKRIAEDEHWNPDVRQELIYVLEDILHRTGNYRGFQYLGQDEVPADHKPGINWEPGLFEDPELRFAHTDPTRVKYY